MADDKKNIPDVASPTEAPAPTVEVAAVPEPPTPDPVLTDAETVMLEHEGQAALFEMGEAIPDVSEFPGVTIPEQPESDKDNKQTASPGRDDPAPTGRVVDFAAARDEAAKEEKKAVKQKPPTEKDKAAKPGRGRPPKDGKAAPDKAKPPKPRDKKSQSKPTPEKPAVDKVGAPAGAEVTPEPSAPRDATRAEKEEIVYLNLSDLHPFKNHPFGVRDDAEMQGLVESVKAAGVNQPALVRPREDGGYEIIAGHRRQRASELAGFANMPCIVRNMTDDEAILAMTDDNLRHRERILPTEKAQSLKMQVEAIKHQGSRPGEEDKDAGKRSTQVVGDRNGMNYKQVQRYKEIVVGRYLFSGILFVSFSVLTFLLCIIAAFTGHFSFTTVVPNLVLGMCCTVLTICLGVPSGFVFKQSNCTGAMIAAIMVCAVIRSTGLDTAFFAASSFLAYALLIIGMALLLYLSYRASLSIFRKRRHARSKVAPND